MVAPIQILKAQLFFEDQRYGWNEAYYSTDVTSQSLGAFLYQAIYLANLRSQLLGVGPKLNYVRVSNDLVRGDSLIATTNPALVPFVPAVRGGVKPIAPPTLNATPVLASGGLPADNPYSAILMRLVTLNGLHRATHPLSGVADDYILDQTLALAPAWNKAFTQFAAYLSGFDPNNPNNIPGTSAWGLKVRDTSVSRANIIAVDIDPGWPAVTGPPAIAAIPSTGYVRVTLDNTIGALLAGLAAPIVSPCDVRLVIQKTKMFPGSVRINGTWQAIPWVNPNSPTLAADITNATKILLVGSQGPVKFMCNGYAQPVQWQVVPIAGAFIERPMLKKRGRPFFSPRGRRAVRRTA